ncbi:MAG: hypothetical protein M3380_17175 [Chloroflexota bacterium]|nr:hypothetical protein [Chloroflexota bacterium]
MKKSPSHRVVFQPDVYGGLQKGINQMVDVVRPTLGPYPRIVAVERTGRHEAPELLDNGGVITRRIIQFPDRDADTGAMLVRHLLWRLHAQVGDGTATAAVLFQSVYNRALKYIVAGGNAMRLRRCLEQGVQAILDELARMTIRIEGKEQLAQIAESVCHDRPLATMLGEIFDIVGEDGHVEIRRNVGRELARHYVEGMFWKSGIYSAHMLADQAKLRTDLQDTAILIGDLEIEDPRHLAPVLDLAVKSEFRTLMIVAGKLSDSSIACLLQASREPEKFQAIAVQTPGLGMVEQAEAMEDLAMLTGGRPLLKAAGDALHTIRREDFGQARKAWADQSYFGVVAGKGDPRMLRAHIATLRGRLQRTEDSETRYRLRQRIGKLMGGSATLLIGSSTEAEMAVREELARRTANALRGALRDGVLLGAGRSLLLCRPRLQHMLEESEDPDEQAAYRILIKALEEPIRTIVANAGYDVGAVMAEINQAAPGSGFDVRCGRIVDLSQAGIFDVAAAQKAAIHSAVTAAALALTIDVLIHPKNPQFVATP